MDAPVIAMRRSMVPFGLGLLVLVSSSSAEIRLHPATGTQAARVTVQMTTAGPWSPVGTIDTRSLNPEGDVAGDGCPAVVPGGAAVLVVWRRGDGSLVARVGQSEWSEPVDVSSSIEPGIPSAAAVNGGWLIAWLAGDGDRHVEVALVSEGGAVSDATVATGGCLVGVVGLPARSAHVVTISAVGEIQDSAVAPAFFPAIPPIVVPLLSQPIPIELLPPDGSWTTTRCGTLGDDDAGSTPNPEPVIIGELTTIEPEPVIVPLPRVTCTPPILIPTSRCPSPDPFPVRILGVPEVDPVPWPVAMGLGLPEPVPPPWPTAPAFPDIRLHSGDRHGEPYALVTWWVSSNELHWIELTEDGPAFPVEVRRAPGSAAYPQSLVQHAVNEVRAR